MNPGKVMLPAAAVTLILSSPQSFAGPPTPGTFDQWSASSCTISASCPIGFSCGTAVIGDGFFQREVKDTNTGNTYFLTIMGNTGKTSIQPIIPSEQTYSKPTPPSRNNFPPDTDFDETVINSLNIDSQKTYHEITDITMPTGSTTTTTGCTQITTYDPEINVNLTLKSPLNIIAGYQAVYRVYTHSGWADFVTNDKNHLASAKKAQDGSCPLFGSALYQPGLNMGAECIQITIEDGGANDGDGIADHTVKFTGGPILRAIPVQPVVSTPSEESAVSVPKEESKVATNNDPANGGGGVWPWWLSSLAAAGLLFRHNRRQRRAV